MDLQCPENAVNLCFLRRFSGAGWKEDYTNLFETSSVWQVFQVCLGRFPVGRNSLEVKKINKAVSMSERVCSW